MNLFNFAGWTWVWETINSLLLIICDWIYVLINWLYQVFSAVAKVNLFSRDVFETITSRIYVIMGVAMLFIFAYNIILLIINPEDKKNIGNAGKLVKETIISFTLIILLPTIFNYMYIFQNNIIDSNIIGQIFLGASGDTSGDSSNCEEDDFDCTCNFSSLPKLEEHADRVVSFGDRFLHFVTLGFAGSSSNKFEKIIEEFTGTTPNDILKRTCEIYRDDLSSGERGAYSVAPIILSAFYRPMNFTYNDCVKYLKGETVSNIASDLDKEICSNYFIDYNISRFTGNISSFVKDERLIQIVSDSDSNSMEFNGVMAIIAGGIAAWMFLCYSLEIGVRVAKLGVLQIISPIPVMMRVIPKQKDAMYDKWFKKLIDTYVDVFIRLLIIFFSLFAISLVPDVLDALFLSMSSSSDNWVISTLASVVVILGILKFGQEAPNLIKDFFGNSGKFALKSPTKQLTENKYGMGAIGMLGGGVASMFNNIAKAKGGGKITSAVGGLFGGAQRGFKYGSQSKDFDALKRGIKTSQAETEAARRKHEAIRREGQINGKQIPIISGMYGQAKHTWEDIKKGTVDFKDFLFGNVASAELGNAANSIMIDVDNMENDFSNATITGIKSGRDEVMKKFNSDQEFDFNGRHYSKVDGNNWQDDRGTSITEKDLRDDIVNSYKNRLAKAYAANESKAGIIEGFKRANEGMLKDLRDAMPKLGEDFSKALFDKLNKLQDANGAEMNLNVHSLDELESRMKNLMQSEAGLASIYKINDEIKSLAKGIKISNDQALKAQAAQKDKKDK